MGLFLALEKLIRDHALARYAWVRSRTASLLLPIIGPAQGDYRTRAAWIPFTRVIPTRWFYAWCKCFVPVALRHRGNPLVQVVRRAFPFSDQGLGVENDILDTFDGYSPHYHWTHEPGEVRRWFEEAGLANVRTLPWDAAVRGQKQA